MIIIDINAYRDEIRLKLTGGVLDLELDDKTIDQIINSALREIQRYITTTKLITIPFSRCIDLSKYDKINMVARVYRTRGYTSNYDGTGYVDPMYASQWQMLSGTGNLYGFQDAMYNYMSWNTIMQIRNTSSTDLAFKYDQSSKQLYINISEEIPANITVEYIPRYDDVSQIVSDYWIDNLIKLAVAIAKVTVGRIRSRFTQSNALYTQDGEILLEEGNAELAELRNHLIENSNLIYGID